MFSPKSKDVKYGTSCAPSILILFINMILLKESPELRNCDSYFFEFQPKLQKMLLATSLVTIPIMLLGKPLYLIYSRKRHFDVSFFVRFGL
jgi:V-type H+-transporting ATPase subunit a